MTPRTHLVTGAAGFIGSHVTEALLKRGDRVLGLDDLNDYYDPARKRANLEEVRAGAGAGPEAAGRFVFTEGDIRDAATVERLLAGSGGPVDTLIHIAAMAGVRPSVERPAHYYDVNVGGTLTLLEACRARAIPHVVFASTSSVYGATDAIPFRETDPCDRPLSPYAASKRACEMLGHTWHHLHGISFTALRFFTVYGPRGRPDMMPFKLFDNMFRGRSVPLYGGGEMLRDWTYVGDIAAGVVAAADRPQGYAVMNIGRGEPVLLKRFIEVAEATSGGKANLDPQEKPAADVYRTWADIGRAKEALGYAPEVSVEAGVARFWDWYRGAVLGG
jgi:UDP-glucuronate 4-epimerase